MVFVGEVISHFFDGVVLDWWEKSWFLYGGSCRCVLGGLQPQLS